MKKLLPLLLCSLLCSLAHAGIVQDSLGLWVGTAEHNGRTMRSGLELYARADGSTGGALVMIDRGFEPARARNIVDKDGALELDGPNGSHFILKLADKTLAGSLQQNGMTLPIKFVRADSFGEPLRAQTPRAPFPYQSSDIVFASADGTKLAATLTRPAGTERVNAVVLVHGTGPEDRDQAEDGHKNFMVLADHLARQGIAVLRYDKRGVKRSGGSYEAHTPADLLADALAAVATLRARSDVLRVGVIGHSEGGEIAARMAGKVDFLVSLAGPGLDLMPVLEMENAKAMAAAGASKTEIEVAGRIGRQFYGIVKDQADVKLRMPALQAMMQAMDKDDRAVMGKYRAQLPTMSAAIASMPWAHASLNTHPQDDWRKVAVPALVLNGEKDSQMSAVENLAAIRIALAHNAKAEIAMLPGLNHNFQLAATGAQDEYARIEETMAPQVLERIARFIAAQH